MFVYRAKTLLTLLRTLVRPKEGHFLQGNSRRDRREGANFNPVQIFLPRINVPRRGTHIWEYICGGNASLYSMKEKGKFILAACAEELGRIHPVSGFLPRLKEERLIAPDCDTSPPVIIEIEA